MQPAFQRLILLGVRIERKPKGFLQLARFDSEEQTFPSFTRMFRSLRLKIKQCPIGLVGQVNKFFRDLLFEIEPGIKSLQRRHRSLKRLELLSLLF